MDTNKQLKFVKQWNIDNEIFLGNVFGLAAGPQMSYLTGILVALASSKHLIPLLQDLIQADGAHSSFGKYTLFSAYGTSVNGNMSPLEFGLLFGNEDNKNWSKSWSFVKTNSSVHQC
jgi:hypothetical protein